MICPTCKKKVVAGPDPKANPFRPFCSDRCRLIDLGAWLEGAHRISEPLTDEDLERNLPTEDTRSESSESRPYQSRTYKSDDRSGRN